jgi:hypothetical protein
MMVINSKTDLTLSPSLSLGLVDPTRLVSHHWADDLNFPASQFSFQNPASLPYLAHSVLEQARDLWDSG